MKKYTSKVLLFGEHTIIKGSQALAIPLPHFSGRWAFTKEQLVERQMNLLDFAKYLDPSENDFLFSVDVDLFKAELRAGLFFESNIPTGYGVGSSGALCAGVYDRFAHAALGAKNDLPTLKKQFAQMESFFHGASSGIDPLVCYVEQPLLIESKDTIKITPPPKSVSPFSLFLLDTQIPRQTSPLVNIFLEKCEAENYVSRLESEFIPEVDDAIFAFLQGDGNLLFEKMHTIGHFQFKYFSEMIPTAFRTIWLDGLASDFYKLKLCGAGGGGFLLGITNDFEKTQAVISDYNLILI